MKDQRTHIFYKEGYKYQLVKDSCIQTAIIPDKEIDEKFITLESDGLLIVRAGYAWDGPSGPTLDTKDSMRGSLFHDALYQLMRMGLLEEKWRPNADLLLRQVCVADGMNSVRARIWEDMVNLFAEGAAKSGSERIIKVAPGV